MLRRRLLERLLLPALIAGACGGESTDLFDSSGTPSATGGHDQSAGEGPEVTGGKATAAGGSNGGGAVTVTGGRTSAGASSGGSSDGGEPSGGVSSGGRASTGGRVDAGGSSAGGDDNPGGDNQGGSGQAGASSGGAPSGGASKGGVANGGGPVAGTGSGGNATCTDSDGGDEKVRGTTKGTNGTFEDKCDDGDLIEYSCETMLVPRPCAAASMPSGGADLRPVPPVDECEVPTGKVIERRVDCGGRCDGGTCFAWCPTLTDEVLVERNGANTAELTNQRTEDVYSCEITYEAENIDCRGSFEGEIFQVFSVGSCDAQGLTIGVDTADEPGVLACSYSCTYQ